MSKWDGLALDAAQAARKQSRCVRDQVGAAVVTDDGDIVAIGYNGTPPGWKNCDEGGCTRGLCGDYLPSGAPPLNDESCVHAERNAVQRAGRLARGATLAVTREPCNQCAVGSIAAAGIKRVVVL